jgi:murein L,D-transpeptidase YcbB/YkuD
MERIIANPVWYVPRSITMNEILPRIKADTGYLRRNGFKILDENYRTVNEQSINLEALSEDNFNYTLRQNRGTENALGQIKFLFSNPYTIYLHDTPGKALFSKDIRAFSHGCIRIKDPERLAGFIIREMNEEEMIWLQYCKWLPSGMILPTPSYLCRVYTQRSIMPAIYFYKDIYSIDEKNQLLTAYLGI